MKTATVADLRNHFSKVSRWIHNGETVTITKRGHTFATLSPVHLRDALPPLDRLARLRRIFPAGPIFSEKEDIVAYDRGET